MTPVFPGWGQLYAGNGWRAALAFGTEMYFWSNLIARDRKPGATGISRGTSSRALQLRLLRDVAHEYWNQMRDFAWWSGGALLIIALDAYVGAHLYQLRRGSRAGARSLGRRLRSAGLRTPVGSAGPARVTVFQWRKGF